MTFKAAHREQHVKACHLTTCEAACLDGLQDNFHFARSKNNLKTGLTGILNSLNFHLKDKFNMINWSNQIFVLVNRNIYWLGQLLFFGLFC